jgi:serine O-acetyltransferase
VLGEPGAGRSRPKLSLFQLLRSDAARYGCGNRWYSELGFWIGATYRLGAWARSQPLWLRLPLMLLYRNVNRVWRFFLRVDIAAGADIGPGLCLVHPHSVMIPVTTIGEQALIFHEVTIGTNMTTRGFPTLGDGVVVYAGARVLGGITIGDGVTIGANCVVTSSVRARALVAPAPNRVLYRDLPAAAPMHHAGDSASPAPSASDEVAGY